MPVEAAGLGFVGAVILGLSFGAGACAITCLPYLGPIMLGTGGVRHAWRVVVPFSLGRLTGYTGLGAAAGMVGAWVHLWVSSPAAHAVLGLATLALGVQLWRRSRRGQPVACPANAGGGPATEQPVLPLTGRAATPTRLGLFAMGAGMAFNPCVPLTTVIVAAAASGSLLTGLTLGGGFGIGAVVVPAVIFALGVAHLGQELRRHLSRWQPRLMQAGAVMLMLLGVTTAIGLTGP